jgi:flagellar assembly factor FliW
MNDMALAELPAADLNQIEFVDGLVGFPGARRFALVPWGDDPETVFSVLRSFDDPSLEFVVVPPSVFFPDYVPEIDDETAARLDLSGDEDGALILTIVTVGDRIEACTVNLLGPIVVNLHTMAAMQAVLSPDRYLVRQPLVS